jgi:hypothetical protein
LSRDLGNHQLNNALVITLKIGMIGQTHFDNGLFALYPNPDFIHICE